VKSQYCGSFAKAAAVNATAVVLALLLPLLLLGPLPALLSVSWSS
jgi:hypothetical protein